jgi:hypothetical protein
LPAKLLGKTHQRPGVVSCSKDHQRRGWEHSLAKHRESGLRSYVSGETRPQSGAFRPLPDHCELRWDPFPKVLAKDLGPNWTWWEFFDEQMNNAVTAQAHPPHKIVFGSSVVSDHLCSS